MKTYMNREERKLMVMVSTLMSLVELEMKNWKQTKILSAEEDKYRKTGLTFLKKFFDGVKNRLDRNFIEQLVRDINATDVFCLPKSEAKIQREKYLKEAQFEMAACSRDTLFDLAEFALIGCRDCKEPKCDCKLKQIFTELCIDPPFNSNGNNSICPYFE